MPKKRGELNQNEFAKLIGVSQPMVAKYIREGTLKRSLRREGSRCYIRPRAGKNELAQNLNPAHDRVIHVGLKNSKSKKQKNDQGGHAEKQQIVEIAGMENIDLNTAKTLETQYKAALRKLEYEEKNQELVSISKLVKVADAAGRQIKEQCLAIADRCSPLVAAENDQFICKQILLKEINYILDGISKMLEVKG